MIRSGNTFGQDFPLARFRARIGWHSFVQVFKQVLHLTPPLPLRQLVADP